jgi:group I intron endonuclease
MSGETFYYQSQLKHLCVRMRKVTHEIIYVYLTINLLDGKQYIGMHRTKNVDDNYLGSGIKIMRAIKKHGKQSFKREILVVCKDVVEAHQKESFFIEAYNTLHPNGYNISPTGGTQGGGVCTVETRKKQSDAKKGKPTWIKGLTKDDPRVAKILLTFKTKPQNKAERSRKISEAHKKIALIKKRNNLGQFTDNEPQTGVSISEETHLKMSNGHRGLASPLKGVSIDIDTLAKRCRSILQYDLQMNLIKEWSARSEASRELGIDSKSITSALCGANRTYKGFIWKYKNPLVKVKILQKSLDGTVLCTWNNVPDASKNTGVRKSAINSNLRGNTRTAYGYIWEKIILSND